MNILSIHFKSKDLILWGSSVFALLISQLISAHFSILSFCAAIIGVTSLLLTAKGHVSGQILMILFSILYGIISYRF